MTVDVNTPEYINILLKRQENQIAEFCSFISESLLSEKLNVSDIPLTILISNSKIYSTAFRVTRNDCNSSINVLKLVIKDYENISTNPSNKAFIERFANFAQEIEQSFGKVKEYEHFKKSIAKEILHELQLLNKKL